jgi:hypothetical protein
MRPSWIVAALAVGLVCSGAEARADASGTWDCRIVMDGSSRGHLAERMLVTVPSPPWVVVVSDEFTDAAMGGPIEAKEVDKSPDRIAFGWTLDLKKRGVGTLPTHFRMTISTDNGAAAVSARWGADFRNYSAKGWGQCRKVAEG